VTEALTAPVLMAAALVCVAGAAKLREPAGAVRALVVLGLPARRAYVRMLGCVELAAGAAVLVAPAGPLPEAVLAALYGVFAGASAALWRRGAGCGCFGQSEDESVSAAHVGLSGVLALVCVAGAVWPPHGAEWTLTRPVLALGIAGSTWAAVLAYTQLPVAWGAWRPR
jgi:Methylamine utilisation protein MauE